jgi:hypothetical protein
MGEMGYILLAVIGYLGLKAFGGTAGAAAQAPSSPGKAGPIDPATGAKLINTGNFMGPVDPQSRIPATDIGNGKQWCPYPFTLYKDQKDGKYYCYNEKAAIGTASAPDTGRIVDTSTPQTLPTLFGLMPSGGVTTDAPVIAQSEYQSTPGLIQPIDPNDPVYQAMLRGDSVTKKGDQSEGVDGAPWYVL